MLPYIICTGYQEPQGRAALLGAPSPSSGLMCANFIAFLTFTIGYISVIPSVSSGSGSASATSRCPDKRRLLS